MKRRLWEADAFDRALRLSAFFYHASNYLFNWTREQPFEHFLIVLKNM